MKERKSGLRNESSKTKRVGLFQRITAAFLLPLIIIYKKVSSTFLLNLSLFWHILLALVFTGFQGMEYYQAPFTISDSIYGSTFFLATGFHGFHVIIGTLFLIICGIRQYLGHLTKEHHVGFEAAAWYWHFVDVVWLFLFVSIYWWGGI